MLVLRKKVGAVVGLLGAATACLALAGPASADTAARSGDVVGVGSDTVQNVMDFLLDGAPGVAGGYNNAGNNHRAFNVFATGDANGRAVYDGTCGAVNSASKLGAFCDTTTNQSPNLLPGTVVLRAGTSPVTRPNGSGAGVKALIADANSNYQGLPSGSIQFARMSRLPKTASGSGEADACTASTACGGLHVYQIATDGFTLVHQASAYNGPASLSIDEAYHIFVLCDYTHWNQIPGNTSGSADTIHPLVPQSGSGTLGAFMADIQTAENLSSTPVPGACTRTVEEHDPTGIFADPTPADAIEPFSTGKLSMINAGYFTTSGYSGATASAYAANYLAPTTAGTAPDGGQNWSTTRGLYIVIRQPDLGVTTPFQSGGTQNWAQTLFTTSTSVVQKAANAPLFSAAGFTQAFKDCGINPTTC
jgi:hypothetical protein